MEPLQTGRFNVDFASYGWIVLKKNGREVARPHLHTLQRSHMLASWKVQFSLFLSPQNIFVYFLLLVWKKSLCMFSR